MNIFNIIGEDVLSQQKTTMFVIQDLLQDVIGCTFKCTADFKKIWNEQEFKLYWCSSEFSKETIFYEVDDRCAENGFGVQLYLS